MSEPKKKGESEETTPDGKTEEEYLKDIETCERKIMKLSFELLKSTYDRYMTVVRGVEETLGWDVPTRLGLHIDKISEICLGIIHSDILEADPEDFGQAQEHLVTMMNFMRIISGKEYDTVKAGYIGAQDPSVGLLYTEELEHLRKSEKLDHDKFEASKEEAMGLQYRIQELKKALLRCRDRKWYETLIVKTGPSTTQPSTSSTAADPAKEPTKNSRANICRKIIVDVRKRIIGHLLDKFNDVHAEFMQISEMATRKSKGEVVKFLTGERNVIMSIARNDRYNNLPKEISGEKLIEVIEDMTHGIKELIIDYENIFQAFEKYQLQMIESTQPGLSRNEQQKALQMFKDLKLRKDAEFKLFDARVTYEQQTVDRFTKEMQEDWDPKKGAQLRQETKEKLDKLIEEMIKIRQENCVATKCPCIEKERRRNLLIPGLGTLRRYAKDKDIVVDILNGANPRKKPHEDSEKFKMRLFEHEKRQNDLEEVMKNVGLD